jgi:hypothetical protein
MLLLRTMLLLLDMGVAAVAMAIEH